MAETSGLVILSDKRRAAIRAAAGQKGSVCPVVVLFEFERDLPPVLRGQRGAWRWKDSGKEVDNPGPWCHSNRRVRYYRSTERIEVGVEALAAILGVAEAEVGG